MSFCLLIALGCCSNSGLIKLKIILTALHVLGIILLYLYLWQNATLEFALLSDFVSFFEAVIRVPALNEKASMLSQL